MSSKALEFVNDYFQLNVNSFLNKYFSDSRQADIKRNITPAKYRELFGSLSKKQREIIDDRDSKYIVVAAGPGSGKTKLLVHKLAALLSMEDVKTDQMLMVAFSRAAVTEFKKRLLKLIGNVAHFVEIKTFHSYAFDLLGRIGTLEEATQIIKAATNKIRSGDVEQGRITKTVLVLDEAQDMNADEFDLVKALIEYNENMKVIAVGDDDQNIFAFANADVKYMQSLATEKEGKVYELVDNYRSAPELVDFSNQFLRKISNRLKQNPIISTRTIAGIINLTRYKSDSLVTPLVNDIVQAPLTGSTCVLTARNREAALVAALLLRCGQKAKLIQTNDGFPLYNLYEIRCFLDQLNQDNVSLIISDDEWNTAIRTTERKLRKSNKWEVVKEVIASFETSCGRRKFRTDLEVFIKESKLEDFYSGDNDTIMVSTIHKAKGREYDNVFLMLDRVPSTTDADLRPTYVAITRAKNTLSVHTNGNQFDGIKTPSLIKINDPAQYEEPSELVQQLTLKDIFLDYFITRQDLYNDLLSGQEMIVKPDGCCNQRGEYMLKFSQKFKEELSEYERKGYKPVSAVANFIVYWKKEGSETESKVIIPEVMLRKF